MNDTRHWITRFSTETGEPYRVLGIPVPRIDDGYLQSVIYLYPSVANARDGVMAGGSGVLVGTKSDTGVRTHIYAVTNSHVIKEGRSPVIRLNRENGGFEILDMRSSDWIHHCDGDDLAMCAVDLPAGVSCACVGDLMFCTKEFVTEHNIGPGDEVFMAGRFISHEGRQKNLPSVRFGNIGMLPLEPVKTSRGLLQECFLVEIRSLPGYSGSPVFLNPLPLIWNKVRKEHNVPIRLLGVDCAHLPHRGAKIKDKSTGKVVNENWIVEDNSGMACVIPAWKVRELLDEEVFVEQRRKRDARAISELPSAILDTAVVPDSAEGQREPFTKADFEDALKRASRKIRPSQSDEGKSKT